MSHSPSHRVVGSAVPTVTVTSTRSLTATEMHAELCEAGWRTDLWGRWISPDPAEARFSFTLAAAWRQHTQETPCPPT